MNRSHVVHAGTRFILFSSVYLLCGGAYLLCGSASLAAADDDELLLQRHLRLPLPNLSARDIRDTFHDRRDGGKEHEATDILAPRDTPIEAVDDGVIQKLFLSKAGGLTVYEFDLQGMYCYYYAHLDHYAAGLKEGMKVKRGEVIGFVGTSGNAPPQTPHLHFAIFRLGPEKHWWQGTAIDPYPILMKSLE